MTITANAGVIRDPVAGRSPFNCAADSQIFERFDRRDIEQSIGERFERQVRRFPDKLAVRAAGQSLTYSELNRQANRVAHLILERTGPGNQAVAILFGQSALMVAAILGTLKAGKFYLPLDPVRHASQNRDFVMDSGAAIILTERSLLDRAAELAPPDTPVLDLSAMGGNLSTENPGLDISPDRLAYLFYTSGSTGRPKGLADTHRNVLHNVMRYTNSLRISPRDRLTLVQPAAFSGAVSSLFCALLNGATSFPFSLQEEGPIRLAAWVSEQGITMFHGVPSIFRLLATGGHRYPALRVIRLEGDRARASDVALYKARFPDGCTLVNGLGATECGIVLQYFVTKGTPVPEGAVPIGYPVEDMEILLLDEAGRPLGPGIVGEIAVRSRYLAAGYWRRPDLTALAFLPDPEGGHERVYRTGDMGRLRADGCLDYLGRRDFQLKIRGQWVEIAEVEEALRQLGAFRDVVVQTAGDGNADARLIAYLVPGERPQADATELRRRLALRLPAHMIPSAFVTLEALPLTSFGKVDRSALPAPGLTPRLLAGPLAEPRDTLQRQLQKIWEDVLQVRPVGVRDSFFDLGGDSLHALTMILEIEHTLGIKLSPQSLLAGSTIEDLARQIGEAPMKDAAPIVPIQTGNSAKPFYFLHGDYIGAGFYCLELAKRLGANRPFYALPPCGADGSTPPESYEAMAKIHIQALRRRQPAGPYLLGGTCNGGVVAYEMARQLVEQGEEIDALIVIASSVFNLRLAGLRRLLAPLRLMSKDAESWALARLHPIWKAIVQLPPARRPGFVVRKALGRARRLCAGMPANSGAVPPYSGRLLPHYQRIDRHYRPAPYPGKVTLLWWEGESEGAEEAARLWSRIAAGGVELHRLPPGVHTELLTGNVEAIANRLKSCLDAVG